MIAALTEKVLPARERFRLVLAGLDRAGLVRFGTEVVAAIRAAPLAQRLRLLWLETLLYDWCEEREPSERKVYESQWEGKVNMGGWTGEGVWWEIWEAGQEAAARYPETCRERFGQLWREFGE